MACRKPCPVCTEDLVAQHLHLLRNVAVSIRRNVRDVPFFLDVEDLVQEGYAGLARAARKWRAELGPFRPLAIKFVRYAMLDAIERAERGPTTVPLDPHHASRADLAGEWEGGAYESNWTPTTDDAPARSHFEAAEEVKVLLRRLPRRLRRVVALRWGLGSGRPRSNREVGRLLGVSRQRVHQLYARGFALLQALAGGGDGAA